MEIMAWVTLYGSVVREKNMFLKGATAYSIILLGATVIGRLTQDFSGRDDKCFYLYLKTWVQTSMLSNVSLVFFTIYANQTQT